MKIRLLCSALLVAGLCFGFQCATTVAQDSTPSLEWPTDESVVPGKGHLRNSEWFKGHFKNRRTGFTKNAAEKQGAIVFLGDSITEGWDHRLESDFPEFNVVSRGISGDVTRTVLYRLQEDVIDLKPRAVVLLIGTNDLDEGNTPEEISANTIEIMERLRAYKADLPVIFCKIMPRSQTPDFRTSFIIIANKLTSDYIQNTNHPNWFIVDTWGMYATDKGVVEQTTMKDFLHPTSESYIPWRDAVKPILLDLKLQK